MTNTTDKSILTAAGKALLAQLNAEEKPLVIDKMIFANVPNRPEFPQPDDVVPSDDVVHEAAVEQRGRLSVDSVIYSTTLTSQEGPFEFNWTGAYCSEYGVLVTIDHHALTPKTADEPGVSGNTLVRSVVLEYKDIAEITNITVDASTWQYNATPRMKKMDDDVAQAIIDQNGKDWFIEDGLLVTPQSGAFNIKAGAGYVSGNRVTLEFDRNVQVSNKPSFIYVDAHREGTPTGEQVILFDLVVTAEEKEDYTDANGMKHFVCKIAQVLGDGSVSDLRPKSESADKDWVLDNFITEVMDFNYDPIFRNVADYDISKKVVWGFLHTGQSLAEGGVGGDVVEGISPPLHPDMALMLSGGPVGVGAATLGETLVALSEPKRVTIGTSFLRPIVESKDGQFQAVFHGQAFGGQNYQAIKKGGHAGVYSKAITQARSVFSARPTLEYRAVSCVHGEQDGLDNNVNYAANLLQLQADYSADLKQITGQNTDVPLLLCQTSTAAGYFHNGGIDELTFPTPLQQLQAHTSSPFVHLVCPKYFLSYYDHSHITNNAQRVLGEYYQKAFESLEQTGNWDPLRPRTVIGNGNIVTISFIGDVGKLTFDTSLVKQAADYGFSYRDEAGNSISDVSINDDNQVVITLTGNVGANAVVAYAYHNGGGGKANQIAGLGDRGNLRDSDTTVSLFDESPLYNWCVTFREVVA